MIREATRLTATRSHNAVLSDRSSCLPSCLVAAAVRLGEVVGKTEDVAAVWTCLTEHRRVSLAAARVTFLITAYCCRYQRVEIIVVYSI